MSPRSKPELAHDHLEAARDDLDGERIGDAINALFYAGEAAVVALAETHGIDTKKSHVLKATAASQLHQKGVLEYDLGPLLRDLNQARKEYWYEGEDPEVDLETAYEEIEWLVDKATEEVE